MFRKSCCFSVLFCLVFLGSGFVCLLFPERRVQFLSALQYRRDAFVHLIVFGAAEKQVFLKRIFVDSLFHPCLDPPRARAAQCSPCCSHLGCADRVL